MDSQVFCETIHTYFRYLEQADLAKVLTLFGEEGKVYSPVYGVKEIEPFYRGLFHDTEKSVISIHAIMANLNDPYHLSARFSYQWKRVDQPAVTFEGVDLFSFTKEGKISQLEIIYDTSVLE
ncbi:MAG: nuclear transport factor 2 family protein [Bacteroidota bacterium]